MLTKDQYRILEKVYALYKCRKNPKNKEYFKQYVELKKSQSQNKKAISVKKNMWKKNRILKECSLSIEELFKITNPKTKFENGMSKELLIHFSKMGLSQYFDKSTLLGHGIKLSNEGIMALEEYRIDRLSRLWLPIVAIVISLLAIVISIFS